MRTLKITVSRNQLFCLAISPAALILALLLCFSCRSDRGGELLQGNLGPNALDLLAPDFHWAGSSESPVPINIPARAGSPILSQGWAAGDHQRDGQPCVLSTGPEAGIHLPFWPGEGGKVKVCLDVQVFHGDRADRGDDRPRVVVSLNGQRLLARPMDPGWFPFNLIIPASRFHQGENEILLSVRKRQEGVLVPEESGRLALSEIELTLPRTRAGLLLERIQHQAIVSTGPVTIELAAALPEGTVLHYSVAQLPHFSPAAAGPVICRVTARPLPADNGAPDTTAGKESTLVCSKEQRTNQAAGIRWVNRQLPLAELAGRKIRLELTAEEEGKSASHPPLHAWGPLVLTWPAGAGPDHRPYNVIIVLADTLRADRTGPGGAGQRLTPHLDRLSRQAVTFCDAAAQAPETYPSMCSMFCGNYYSGISQEAQAGRLPAGAPTIGEIFSANGFQTVAIVSNPLMRPEAGFSRGFHRFDNSLVFEDAPQINRRLLKYLPTLDRTRFFAWLHYMDIHAPYGSPESTAPEVFGSGRLKGQAWDGGLLPVVREFVEHGQCSLDRHDRSTMAGQYDEGIGYWDRQLARLLASLDQRGILSNTIVVVIADHGEEFFEHGLVNHGQSLYRELVHVPALILFPPGCGIEQPQQVARPIELLDIVPTLFDFMDIPLPELFRGRSRLPLLLGDAGAEPQGAGETGQPRFFETRKRSWVNPPFNSNLSGIHYGRWKLIHNRLTGEDELFDLSVDPGETSDLAGDRPDKVGELKNMVNTVLDQTEAGPASEALDRREREALEALGYIQ